MREAFRARTDLCRLTDLRTNGRSGCLPTSSKLTRSAVSTDEWEVSLYIGLVKPRAEFPSRTDFRLRTSLVPGAFPLASELAMSVWSVGGCIKGLSRSQVAKEVEVVWNYMSCSWDRIAVPSCKWIGLAISVRDQNDWWFYSYLHTQAI